MTDNTDQKPYIQHEDAASLGKRSMTVPLFLGGAIVVAIAGLALYFYQNRSEPTSTIPVVTAPVDTVAEPISNESSPPIVQSRVPNRADANETARVQEAQVSQQTVQEEPRIRRLGDGTGNVSEWDPTVQLQDVEVTNDIELSLEQAKSAFDAGNYYLPAGESALDNYRSVLESNPDNLAAIEGIDLIVDQLLTDVTSSKETGDYEQALQLLSVIEQVRPGEPEILLIRKEIDVAVELIAYLQSAESAMAEQRFTAPESDNAVHFYQQALGLDPQDSDAVQGLVTIEQRLLEQAIESAQAMDFNRAEELLTQADTIRPDANVTDAARNTIDSFRGANFNEIVIQFDQSLNRGDISSAQVQLKKLEEISATHTRLPQLRSKLRTATQYGPFEQGQIFADTAPGSETPEMVVISVGKFSMGSPTSELHRKKNEGPMHTVELNVGFAIARREITVAQFRSFVTASNYQTDAEKNGNSTVYDERSGRIRRRDGIRWDRNFSNSRAKDNEPVIHISWNDATAYADWLSQLTQAVYRLPSEAEFEYVLKSGGNSIYWWGDASPAELVVNTTGDGDHSRSRRTWNVAFTDYTDGFWGPAPVGNFKANSFNVFDMGGNVSEWVGDCWHDSYVRAPDDGSAWVNPGCSRRIIRGGSWASTPDRVRSAYRVAGNSNTTSAQIGFRVVRELVK